jgi:hypothetical protein
MLMFRIRKPEVLKNKVTEVVASERYNAERFEFDVAAICNTAMLNITGDRGRSGRNKG